MSFAAVAITSYLLLQGIRTSASEILDDALPGVTAAGRIRGNLAEAQIAVLRHLPADTAEAKQHEEQFIQAMVDENTKTLAE